MESKQKDQVRQYQTYISYYIAVHVLSYTGWSFVFDLPLQPVLLQVLLSALAFLGTALYKAQRQIALDLTTVALALTPAAFIAMMQGQAWQLDAHMYFFAVLAVTISLKSMRASILAALSIMIYNVGVNFTNPALLYPEAENLLRILFHGVMLIVETAAVLFTIYGLRKNDEDLMAESQAAQQALKEAKAARQLQEEAETRSKEERRLAMRDIAQNFDAHVGGLVTSMAKASSDLQATAQAMRGIADKTSHDVHTVASASEQASGNVNAVSEAMNNMSSTSHQIASQVSAVRGQSATMSGNARNANESILNLDQLADNIGGVVVSIRDIADQTNLLALNATIEAARAGEAGKGFAVVADEVKKLAGETAQKTEEIEARVNEIQEATKASVQVMEAVIANITTIDGSMRDVTAAVDEQNATTAAIIQNITETSQGVQQAAQVATSVQSSANKTGESSNTVLHAAQELHQLADRLKASVDTFLADIQNDK